MPVINDFDIKTQGEQIYMSIGTCPQHDIFWDDLSACEHFAVQRLSQGRAFKSGTCEGDRVIKTCASSTVRKSSHRGLNGGEKRHLSMVTTLAEDLAVVVFLDEPTTVLDKRAY